jgi:protein TonB
MLETALLSTRPAARAHAIRVSLPVIVALHGAVLAGFVVASSLREGEPPEPITPIVFGTLGSLAPPPKGDGGPRTDTVPVRAPHAATPRLPRLDAIPDTISASRRSTAETSLVSDALAGDGTGTSPGRPDGVDGAIPDPGDEAGKIGGDQPLTPGGDVSYPILVHRVEPDYPRAAIVARSQGVVVLDAIITASGDVEEVRVLKSANPLLDDAALRAVRQWTYRPATLDGRAVRVRLTVTVTFAIPAG